VISRCGPYSAGAGRAVPGALLLSSVRLSPSEPAAGSVAARGGSATCTAGFPGAHARAGLRRPDLILRVGGRSRLCWPGGLVRDCARRAGDRIRCWSPLAAGTRCSCGRPEASSACWTAFGLDPAGCCGRDRAPPWLGAELEALASRLAARGRLGVGGGGWTGLRWLLLRSGGYDYGPAWRTHAGHGGAAFADSANPAVRAPVHWRRGETKPPFLREAATWSVPSCTRAAGVAAAPARPGGGLPGSGSRPGSPRDGDPAGARSCSLLAGASDLELVASAALSDHERLCGIGLVRELLAGSGSWRRRPSGGATCSTSVTRVGGEAPLLWPAGGRPGGRRPLASGVLPRGGVFFLPARREDVSDEQWRERLEGGGRDPWAGRRADSGRTKRG